MDNENQITGNAGGPDSQEASEQVFSLLAQARNQGDLTVRDDLYSETLLLDAVRICRKKGRRFRLVDSGRLDRFQLEWLLEAGADLYTSDEVRKDLSELEGLLRDVGRGRAQLSLFVQGALFPESFSQETERPPLFQLGAGGAFIHVSNREAARDWKALETLALECRSGGSHIVYYFHGDFNSDLGDLAAHKLWIHLSEESFAQAEARSQFLDLLKSSRTQARFVLFSQGEQDARWLQELFFAGAYIIFLKKQFDYRSPYKAIERKAVRRQLPHTAFYLYPDIML